MNSFPIVRRELRVASRRAATYLVRWLVAFLALGASLWIYGLTYRDAPKEVGLSLFTALTVLANLYALLAGLRTTADCLSSEKREGTLGLLFLTDLRGYDIVLGKLAATSLNAFYGVLAIFPDMGISLLLGGVTPAELGRVILVSVNNLLFSLAVGMFCSSVSADDRKATHATFLVVVCLAALPILGIALAESRNYSGPHLAFLIPSPAFTCFAAFDANFSGSGYASAFWVSLASLHAMIWVLLGLACWIVPRTWQDQATASGARRWTERLQQWRYGPAAIRQAMRTRLLEPNPVLWLANRERFKTLFVLLVPASLAIVWIVGRCRVGPEWIDVAAIPIAVTAHSLLKVWLANEASRRFCEDRRSGALELLLATPLSIDEILHGQRLALWRQFVGPALLVLGGDTILMFVGERRVYADADLWVGVWLAGMTMFAWDLHALIWVSPWLALNRRSPSQAARAALTRICVLPWLLFVAAFALMGLLAVSFNLRLPEPRPGGLILTWFILGGAVNLYFTWWASFRLKTGFREAATRPFEAAPPYGEWGRALGQWLRGKG